MEEDRERAEQCLKQGRKEERRNKEKVEKTARETRARGKGIKGTNDEKRDR